ncbi:MAG: hypothetical protein ACR2KV_16025 [Solirubrobacteraceae bacterium]
MAGRSAFSVEAEIRAKAAILVGPDRAGDHLPDGGVIVHDDATVAVVDPGPARPAPPYASRGRQSSVALRRSGSAYVGTTALFVKA